MKTYAQFRPREMMKTAIFALLAGCILLLSGHALAADIGDDFSDNLKNKTIWGKDSIYGNGVLKEINQRLEYAFSTSTAEDSAKRLLIAREPYNADWQAQIDLFNSTNPSQQHQLNSFGIAMYHCEDSNDWLYAEMYASSWAGPPGSKGFFAEFATSDIVPPFSTLDTGDLAGTNPLAGAVQISFNSLTKVISVSYAYSGGGWIPFGSYGVSAGGGGAVNGNWQMTDSDQFCMKVYGYSEKMAVGGGKVYGDNFLATGVAAPVTTRILQPNGGEIVPAGELYHVAWEAPAEATTFKLKYSIDNGATWLAAAPGLLTGTSYEWPVPVPANNKRKCLLKLTGFDGGVKIGADSSDAPFTIEVLRLIYPNGGEPFTSGDQPVITWTTSPHVTSVHHVVLSYTLNNGLDWRKIDTSADPSDDGSFIWTVPAVTQPKANCKVKIVLKDAAGNTLGSDVSDAVFTINPAK